MPCANGACGGMACADGSCGAGYPTTGEPMAPPAGAPMRMPPATTGAPAFNPPMPAPVSGMPMPMPSAAYYPYPRMVQPAGYNPNYGYGAPMMMPYGLPTGQMQYPYYGGGY
jgi:hypothetical protein